MFCTPSQKIFHKNVMHTVILRRSRVILAFYLYRRGPRYSKATKRTLRHLRKRALYIDNAWGAKDCSCASCLRPSWSYASALWSYMVFRRLNSAFQATQVTVQTISLLIQRCCLKQWMCSSYPVTLQSQQSSLLWCALVDS